MNTKVILERIIHDIANIKIHNAETNEDLYYNIGLDDAVEVVNNYIHSIRQKDDITSDMILTDMEKENKGILLQSRRFDGDIVITDPAYIFNNKIEDWHKAREDIDNMMGSIQHKMFSFTYYGDWLCSVYDMQEGEVIGTFTADSAFVAVLDYTELQAYNPEAEEWINAHTQCATVIKNFHGTVHMVLHTQEYMYENEKHEYQELKLYGIVDHTVVWMARQTGF